MDVAHIEDGTMSVAPKQVKSAWQDGSKSAWQDAIQDKPRDNIKGGAIKSTQLRVSQHVQKFGDSTTLHGIQYVTGKNVHPVRRCIWLLVVLTALGWSIYNIILSCVEFNQYNHSTSINIVYDDEGVEFPAVTICNLNQWQRYWLDDATYLMLTALYTNDQDERDEYDWNEYYQNTVSYHEDGFINLTALALSPRGALAIDVMLMECTWNSVVICDSDDFTRVLTDLGVCYTFNNEKDGVRRVITKPGIDSGLTMTLQIDQDQYIAGEFQGAGIKVLLHPHGELPLMKELGFTVAPGFETVVSVKPIEHKSLPSPYRSNCTNADARSLKYSDVYTVPLCQYECKIDYVTEKCGCKDYRYPNASSDTLCSPENMFNCSIPSEAAFTSQSNVTCTCPLPCTSSSYDWKLSSSYWPSGPSAEQYLYEEDGSEEESEFVFQDLESMRKSALRIKIYFEELSHTTVEQVASYDLGSLGSDIGGSMGLFCGMSLITVVEFADFFCMMFLKHMKRRLIPDNPRSQYQQS